MVAYFFGINVHEGWIVCYWNIGGNHVLKIVMFNPFGQQRYTIRNLSKKRFIILRKG